MLHNRGAVRDPTPRRSVRFERRLGLDVQVQASRKGAGASQRVGCTCSVGEEKPFDLQEDRMSALRALIREFWPGP